MKAPTLPEPQKQVIVDTECYPNYWLAMVKSVGANECLVVEARDGSLTPNDRTALNHILATHESIGFNSLKYDLPMIAAAIKGYDTEQLKRISNAIIRDKMMPWTVEKAYDLELPEYNHIDLIEVCPLYGSLKLYAARLNCKTIQDIPYHPDEPIYNDDPVHGNQIDDVINYCYNDLENTELIFNNLKEQIALRRSLSDQYGIDLRSKSDAQIAEKIIVTEITRSTGVPPSKPDAASISQNVFRYNVPETIRFNSPVLIDLLDMISHTPFTLDSKGAIQLPASLKKLTIPIGDSTYKVGVGGLHSSEENISHVADGNFILRDSDCRAYYPSLIVENKLYPEHLGESFLNVYKALYEKRNIAKKRVSEIKKEIAKIEKKITESKK